MFGIDNFDVIVNLFYVGIFVVGVGIKKLVVGEDGELIVVIIMSVIMFVDYCVIDGVVGVNLFKVIVDNLENLVVMLV